MKCITALFYFEELLPIFGLKNSLQKMIGHFQIVGKQSVINEFSFYASWKHYENTFSIIVMNLYLTLGKTVCRNG